MSARTWLCWLLLCGAGAAAGAACSDDDGGEGEGEGDGDADADVDGDADADADADGDCDLPEPAPLAPVRGQVRVSIEDRPEGAYGNAYATFYESDPPIVHTEVLQEGDCRLVEYHAELCDQYCAGVCTDGVCVPYPGTLTAGTVTLTGLGGDLRLDDMGGGIYYASLQDKTLVGGAPVGIEATGGEQPAFSLDSVQPAPLEVDLPNDELQLPNGQDTVVHWTPADPCRARVHLTLKTPTQAHGTPPMAMIECDAPDTGSLVIPQAIVEAFPETRRKEICVLHDCPASTIVRRTRVATGEGTESQELVVESLRTFFVLHPAP